MAIDLESEYAQVSINKSVSFIRVAMSLIFILLVVCIKGVP